LYPLNDLISRVVTCFCLKKRNNSLKTIAKLATDDIGDNHAILFAQDGDRLISTGNFRMVVWDTATWERIYDSGWSYPGSHGISLSPNGRLLPIATDNNRIRLVDIETLAIVRDLYMHEEVWDVDFSPDGTSLLAVPPQGAARIWEIP